MSFRRNNVYGSRTNMHQANGNSRNALPIQRNQYNNNSSNRSAINSHLPPTVQTRTVTPMATVPDASTDNDNGTENDQSDVEVDWGDEDDELFCLLTQEVEEKEGIQKVRNPSPPVSNKPNATRLFPRCNSDEKPANTPQENLNLRRQHIADKSQDQNQNVSEVTLKTCERTEADWQRLSNLLKSKMDLIHNQKTAIMTLQGEAAVLRQAKVKLVTEQQEEIKKRLIAHNESRKETREISRLQTEIRDLKCELLSLKLKRNKGPSPNTSLNNSNASSSGRKEGVSPNASIERSEIQMIQPPQPKRSTKQIQTDEPPPPPLQNVSPVQEKRNVEIIDRFSLNDQLFNAIDEIIEFRFELLLPKFEIIVKKAPTHIMRRLVSNVESKPAFPDVLDSMFQWSMDQERRKLRQIQGMIDPKPPMMPAQYPTGIYFHKIKVGLQTSFKNAGVWGALREVKDCLHKILESLNADGRFRMYEYHTLVSFWKLLYWGSELWGCLICEEETVKNANKVEWRKELEEWTGLVLKCDWRDYFVIELEKEVRGFTLGILHDIVMTGYFEQKKNRYEILYRVMKDVLTTEAFRTVRNVQKIIKIVTWSIPNVTIIKYLCYKNNAGYCLAHLIGENVAILCGQEVEKGDLSELPSLFVDYSYLLDRLMKDSEINYPCSKSTPSVPNDGIQNQNRTGNHSAMDTSFFEAASQFACPVKYSTKPVAVNEETDEKTLSEELRSWLDPKKYEDPFGKKKYCQCRKTLMGTAISSLKIVFDFWNETYLDHENAIEELEAKELGESRQLVKAFRSPHFSTKEEKEVKRKRLTSIREKQSYLQKMAHGAEEMFPEKEWNHNDIYLLEKQKFKMIDIPYWLEDRQRSKTIIDLALSKGLIIMNFLQNRSENLAAAIGTDNYKTFMLLIPLMRLYMVQIDFNPVDRNVLMMMTPECEEDHLGSTTTVENNSVLKSNSTRYPNIEFPMTLDELFYSEATQLKSESETCVKNLRASKRNVNEINFQNKYVLDENRRYIFSNTKLKSKNKL